MSLAPISDPGLVIPTIAQTLGLWEAGERSLLEQLQVFLSERQVLLLLDNFEQVVRAATHVANLLTSCPLLKVLVTSREVLHVRAEREFPVPALSLPDPKRLPDLVSLSQYQALALFLQRAQAVSPEFEATNVNAPVVAEICVRLDGLPLAIELAATRIKLLPPQALLTRLGQRLQLLTSNARDMPARQQTLRNTIQWSYDLLDAQEQRLFCLLSVFVGGCTLVAVEEVLAALGNTALPVLDGVASLLNKYLLHQTAQQASRGEGGGEAAKQTVRLETALSWFWTIRGYQNDGRRRPRQLFLDLEEALSTEEAVPMPPSTEIRQPPAPPARGTPPAPAGLTEREVEVLCLLAQGWTDAQIARHLVISPRTVNHHTTSLYSKLGVSSQSRRHPLCA